MASNNTTDPDHHGVQGPFNGEHIGQDARAAFGVIGSVLILCGVIGNSVLFAIVVKHFLRNRKRHLHDLFIVNLILGDLFIMGYWFSFLVIDIALGFHPVADGAHCTANGIILFVLMTVNKDTLISISLNRYLYVCHSHLYRRVFTLPRTVCWCLLIWLFSILLPLPPLWEGAPGPYRYNAQMHICSYEGEHFTYLKAISVLYSVLSPFLIAYFNFAIFRFWRKMKMSLTNRYPVTKRDRKMWRKMVAKCRAGVNSKKAGSGCVTDETVLEQGHQLQNPPETFVQSRQVVHKHFVEEQTGTLLKGMDETLDSLTISEETERSQTRNEGDASDYDVMTQNSCGFQDKEIVTDSVSSDPESVDSESVHIGEDDVSGDELENHQEQLDDCIYPQTGDNTVSSGISDRSGTCDEAADLNPRQSHSHKQAKESKTKIEIETPDTRVDTGSLHLNPASVAAAPATAPLPKSAQTSMYNPHKRHSSKQRQSQKQLRKKIQAREEAFVRSLLVVCILTFVTFESYTVLVIVDSFVEMSVEVRIGVYMMLYLNNTISWIVYGTMNPAFKRGYVKYARQVINACRRAKMSSSSSRPYRSQYTEQCSVELGKM